ncbi:MAG: D-alanyl-D-alanine carboxypeptidase/D-alanyl-D-alanine endopeptidase, partial [Acidimicrobiales bacterium]
MRSKVITAVAVAGALIAGAGAVVAGPGSPTHDPSIPVAPTGVFSPRRTPGVLSEAVGEIRLGAALNSVLTDARFADVEDSSCLLVRKGGTTVFQRDPDRSVVPASTLKLVTAWAALKRFGAGHRFSTEVRAPARPNGGAVERLWLVGGGDPLLATAPYTARFFNQPQISTSMEALADRVKAAGVVEVSGPLLGDDGRFDSVRYLASWKEAYVLDSDVGPVSPLVVNDNFVTWGAKDVPAADPAVHGASVLRDLLRDRGVKAEGPAARGAAPVGSVLIATISSPPMSALVTEMLSESDNLTAEVLVKAMGQAFGRGGSWPAGLEVIKATVSKSGLAVGSLTQLDGSGLERDNRLNCRLLISVLEDPEVGAALFAGLPVAGETGTLSTRLTEEGVRGKIRAKTGSLDFVAGLVGFAESPAGPLSFAVVGNGLPLSARAGRD